MASKIISSNSTRPSIDLDVTTLQSDILSGDRCHVPSLGRMVAKLAGIEKKLISSNITGNASAVPNRKISSRECLKAKVSSIRKKILNQQYELCWQAIQSYQSVAGPSHLQKLLVDKIVARRNRKGLDAFRPLAKREVKRAVKSVIKSIKVIGNKAVGKYRTRNVLSSFMTANKVKLPPAITLGEQDFMNQDKATREDVLLHAEFCGAAYNGFNTFPSYRTIPAGCRLLKADELPEALQLFYNEDTGLLHAPDNVKALLVGKNDEVVIAFAGTEPGRKKFTGRKKTVKADATQWVGLFTPMYRSAAALMKILLSNPGMGNLKFSITGHSLGGGLAQFAFTAIQSDHPGRFKPVYTFNSAGLSQRSLNGLGAERINKALDNIHNVRIKGDPVSPSGKTKSGNVLKGYLLGGTLTLNNKKGRTLMAHSISTIQDVLVRFVK